MLWATVLVVPDRVSPKEEPLRLQSGNEAWKIRLKVE